MIFRRVHWPPFGPRHKLGAIVVALFAWIEGALGDVYGIPTQLPLGEIKLVDRDWRPRRCGITDSNRAVCAIEAYFACLFFMRRDLCEIAGWHPRQVPMEEDLLFGDRGIDGPLPDPSLVQYRLVEFRNLDERFSPPVLVVGLELRRCYRSGPPPVCDSWEARFVVLTSLDTPAPYIAELGWIRSTP
jgi:hypothetical protein